MERTNDLECDKVFARYAIGGGIGALFYMELMRHEPISCKVPLTA